MTHIWGVSTQSKSQARMEHVTFTVHYRSDELFIPQRLEREKRCGIVEHLDAHTSRFSADVYDANELIPWIRTLSVVLQTFSFQIKRWKNNLRMIRANV